jgi:hypothetical protein
MATNSLKTRDIILLAYHSVTAIAIIGSFFNGGFSSGPCNMGLGLMLYALTGLILIVLLAVSITLFIKSRSNKYFLIINVSAFIIWVISMFLI